MSKWFVYLVRCGDDSLYTGITTDIKRRFEEHQDNSTKTAKYLRGKGPLKLVWHISAKDRSQASKLEHTIKQLLKADKERLIKNDKTILDHVFDHVS